MKKVAVIIVVYKFPHEKLQELLKSLHNEGIIRRDIYVVDNTINNIGYGGGINSALKKIIKKYKYFLILNPDVSFKRPFINPLLSAFQNSSSVGIVGPKILDEKGRIWANGGILNPVRFSGGLKDIGKENSKTTIPFESDFVSGTAMLIKKEVFEKIGLFSEEYFLYYEDVDFCTRAKNAGFSSVTNPSAILVHSASSSVGKNSPLMQYYMARNHLLFEEKFAPIGIKIREIIRLPKTIFEARKRKYELLGIRDFFLRKFDKNDEVLGKVDIL